MRNVLPEKYLIIFIIYLGKIHKLKQHKLTVFSDGVELQLRPGELYIFNESFLDFYNFIMNTRVPLG